MPIPRSRPPAGPLSAALAATSLVLALAGCGHAPRVPLVSGAPPPRPPASAPRTTQAVLDAATPADWAALDPADLLVLELPAGPVVIALAPGFAPRHAANLRALARGGYWDGLAVVRVQDNFVVQWADPAAGEPGARVLPAGAAAKLPAEFTRPAAGLAFTRLPDRDGYAPETGFSGGFAAGRDPATGEAWLLHCYGAVGAGRDDAPDSSNGTELYAVIGQAPRQLDRNITVVGRVVQGLERLAALPRATGAMGFFEQPGQRIPIRRVAVAADLPEAERPRLEALRTEGPAWEAFVESRRNRREAWYLRPAGHVDACNLAVPVRAAPRGPVPPPAPGPAR